MSEPCSMFLWRRGRRSGPSLEHWSGVVVPIRFCASWEPRDCLGVGAAVHVQATVDRLCAKPRLGRCRGCTAVEGSRQV